MAERKPIRPHVPPTDTDIISTMADMSKRMYDPFYIPPYKIGKAFLERFVNKPLEERAQEYPFEIDTYLLEQGLEEVLHTNLGASYDMLLYYKEKRAGYDDGTYGTDTLRFGGIREDIVNAFGEIGEHVARLEQDPTHKYEVKLLSYSGRTRGEAEEALRHDLAAEHLVRDRYHDENLDDIKPLIGRSALLNALGFNLTGGNTIVRSPNFVARIATDDENTTRIIELWWGWGHPNVFYAQDTTEVKGDRPQVTVTEKVVVASVYDIAKYFTLLHTEPQDMKIKFPADPQPASDDDTDEFRDLVNELKNLLGEDTPEK